MKCACSALSVMGVGWDSLSSYPFGCCRSKLYNGQFCESSLEVDDDKSKDWAWTSGAFEWADSSQPCVWTSINNGTGNEDFAWLGTYEQASLDWTDYECTADLRWSAKDASGTRGVMVRMNADSSELDSVNGVACSVRDGNSLIVENVATLNYQTVATRNLGTTLAASTWYNLTLSAFGDSVMCYLEHMDDATGNFVSICSSSHPSTPLPSMHLHYVGQSFAIFAYSCSISMEHDSFSRLERA